MKILLTGAAGQLGRELTPLLAAYGEVIRVDVHAPEGDVGIVLQDLGDLKSVKSLLDREMPEIIFNAAAYTAVDLAEDAPEVAHRLNAELPARLASWAAANDSFLVHYSTDYVFSGKEARPLTENDEPSPLNIYGESKLAGEQAVLGSGCRNIVLRTSWVYSSHGNNFVLTMLRLARERTSLSIVADQTGRPTWARNLARVSCGMTLKEGAAESPQGLYHYCDGGEVTWFGFAEEIFKAGRQLGLIDTMPELTPVTSAEYPQKARRPGYSVLDTAKIEHELHVPAAGLMESLVACLREVENE